jgi:hypothetical protein
MAARRLAAVNSLQRGQRVWLRRRGEEVVPARVARAGETRVRVVFYPPRRIWPASRPVQRTVSRAALCPRESLAAIDTVAAVDELVTP